MPQLSLKSQLIERASRAVYDRQWHVASVIYATLEAIEIDDMINDTGRAAGPRTVAVPLMAVPMRDERPRAFCASPRHPGLGTVCTLSPGHTGVHQATTRQGPVDWPNVPS
jgi:hypothetical protein